MDGRDPLLGPVEGAEHQQFGGVTIDVLTAGDARLKRLVYPPGMRWSVDLQPLVGGERCMHAHVGFLLRGRLHGEYADGCTFAYTAPQAVVIEPGHDAWVEGDEPAVLVQLDYEAETTSRLGLATEHGHAG